jgi:hypothetical protein
MLDCPHARYSPGFGKFAIKEIDGPPPSLQVSSVPGGQRHHHYQLLQQDEYEAIHDNQRQ